MPAYTRPAGSCRSTVPTVCNKAPSWCQKRPLHNIMCSQPGLECHTFCFITLILHSNAKRLKQPNLYSDVPKQAHLECHADCWFLHLDGWQGLRVLLLTDGLTNLQGTDRNRFRHQHSGQRHLCIVNLIAHQMLSASPVPPCSNQHPALTNIQIRQQHCQFTMLS